MSWLGKVEPGQPIITTTPAYEEAMQRPYAPTLSMSIGSSSLTSHGRERSRPKTSALSQIGPTTVTDILLARSITLAVVGGSRPGRLSQAIGKHSHPPAVRVAWLAIVGLVLAVKAHKRVVGIVQGGPHDRVHAAVYPDKSGATLTHCARKKVRPQNCWRSGRSAVRELGRTYLLLYLCHPGEEHTTLSRNKATWLHPQLKLRARRQSKYGCNAVG